MTEAIDREDLGQKLVPRIDDVDGEWVNFSEEFEREIETYREAVRQNIENNRITAFDHRVIVRLMPKDEYTGGVIAHRTMYPQDGTPISRYGTVIAVGDYMADVLEPGDEVCFSQMFGKRFRGPYNPLSLDDEDAGTRWADWSDEIRIFKMDDDHYEIFGVVEYNLVGQTVAFDPPGGEPSEVEVVEESALLGGIARIDDGEDTFWVPQRYIDE